MQNNLTGKLFFILAVCFFFTSFLFGQDTLKHVQDTVKQAPASAPSTTTDDKGKEYMGVAVSPSTLRFNVKPGSSQIKTIKISNDTKGTKKFNINLEEFDANEAGKPTSVKLGSRKYGLSKWLNITPSYVELKSGEQKTVNVELEVPNNDSAAIAAWAILTVDEVRDRQPLSTGSGDNKNTLALGITPSIGFGVYLYQNPPNVNNLNVEITSLAYQEKEGKRNIILKCKNMGDGIGFCNQYIDMLNVTTGEQKKTKLIAFTILPGFVREFTIELPKLTPGKYSAAGIIDFGSKEYVQTAELEFTIQ